MFQIKNSIAGVILILLLHYYFQLARIFIPRWLNIENLIGPFFNMTSKEFAIPGLNELNHVLVEFINKEAGFLLVQQ